jgi:hypothetical protein
VQVRKSKAFFACTVRTLSWRTLPGGTRVFLSAPWCAFVVNDLIFRKQKYPQSEQAMELKLLLIQKDIDTYAEIKDLSKIQQKQIAIELKAYFGKKVVPREAFGGECMANFWQAFSADDLETALYDFWEINTDSGGVFISNTTDETGVEMIQGSFGVQAKFIDDEQAALLAEAFSNAEKTKQVNHKDYEFNESGEITDFKSGEMIPLDTKQWNRFLKNYKVSEGFIRKYHPGFNKSCWSRVCETSALSETFMLAFSNKINWDVVSQYQHLSEGFIREQQGRLNWTKVSFHQKLSENFIREFQNTVNWDYISSQQVLSEAFMKEFRGKISWDTISWAQPISYDFIREFHDKINWTNLCAYQKLSEEFLRECSHQFDWSAWYNISKSQVLSSAFISDFAESIQWRAVSMNPYLTDEQLRAYRDKLDWRTLIVFGRTLSEALLAEFQDHITLPESMAQDNWKYILENKKKFTLSEEFKQEILRKINAKK